MRLAYLHGFASGPFAYKGQRLKAAFEARGISLALPDLNVPSFEALSVRAMLSSLDDRGDERWAFIGSSLGGWVAARFAELHPDRVARLVLLCPAFDLSTRWPALMPEGAMAKWKERGALVMADGAGAPRPLHYGFYEELSAEPARPDVSCPTLILHGTRDERVSIESSREYAAAHANVRLVELDDVHDLHASIELIIERALAFLA